MSRWSREAALLGIPDLPEEAFKHYGDRRIKPQSGGGGGTNMTYTSNIPEWAEKPFMDMVGRAEAVAGAPYQAYTGPRIQGFTPLQQQAQANASAQTPSQFTQAGAGLAGAAATRSFTDPGAAAAYMSPYMQNVVDINKREALRDAAIADTQRASQMTQAGAFGGTRQAVMDAEADRNLQTRLYDIQNQGLQAAFESGQGQFNNEMSRALQGAQTMGTLGQSLFGQQMDITQLLQAIGQQQQDLGQRQLDQQYNDFQTQQNYPYQQIGFLSDILRGTQGTTRTMYETTPSANPLQTIAGLGTAASAFMAKGGKVQKNRTEAPAGLTELALSRMKG